MARIVNLDTVVETILEHRSFVPRKRSVLVGLSGIDGSGKGYLAKQIVPRLWQRSVHAVTINVDGWLNLPHIRFDATNPAEHFYNFAIRLDEMFRDLIVPFRNSRSCRITADFATETATKFEKHTYDFRDVDVIVLEGIFIFKTAYLNHFDLRLWIDCSFETALARGLARQQEQLSPEDTIHAFETIYFPAQRLHFQNDHPRASADLILDNDQTRPGRASALVSEVTAA
jgi:uridine kinase